MKSRRRGAIVKERGYEGEGVGSLTTSSVSKEGMQEREKLWDVRQVFNMLVEVPQLAGIRPRGTWSAELWNQVGTTPPCRGKTETSPYAGQGILVGILEAV